MAPTMSPMTSPTMDLLKIGLLSEKLSPMELRTFADWTLKSRLLAVPGVADCKVFGGEVRQMAGAGASRFACRAQCRAG